MKALKKLSCVFLAVLLLMSLSVNAFAAAQNTTGNTAAGSGVFTITIKETMSGHVYKAYQILSGDLYETEDANILSNVVWGVNVNQDDLPTEMKDARAYAELHLDADATDKIDVRTFADTIREYLIGDGQEFIQKEEAGTYVLDKVTPGYYLILDEKNDTTQTDFFLSSYIVEVVDNVEASPKGSVPHVEKGVQDKNDSTGTTSEEYQDTATYDVNDHVPFQLTATLPSKYADFETYFLCFHDTLSAGLTFNNDVEVYLNEVKDENVVDASKYVVAQDGQKFTVTFNDLKTVTTNGSDTIIVRYSATLNDGANKGLDGNSNSVYLEYSNDPDSTGTGEPGGGPGPEHGHTPDDVVIVFTFNAVVNKVEQDPENPEATKPLAGAAFALEKWNGSTWVTVKDYAPANNATTDQVQFSFNGVDDGYYRLRETVVPAGYNKCDDIYFALIANYTTETDGAGNKTTYEKLTVKELTYDETTNTCTVGNDMSTDSFTVSQTADLSQAVTNVKNERGLVLPETGGIGTTIFYVLGGILVAAAVVLLITKKRMTKEG